jgi:hypothetical protein
MHVCHSCFLLHTAGGTDVLIDPYFGGPFRWKGHEEKHLGPPPAFRPEELGRLDGVVVTHDHPDHCQPDALYAIMSSRRCGLWGPSGIYRRAVEVGIDNRRVTKVDAFQRFTIKDLEVLALPNKGSEDTKPCMRMSYLFASGETSVFHGGDSHGPSPSWSGHVEGCTLALLWPNHIQRAVSALKPFSVALMHCDRFEPGDFLCGYDQEEILSRLRKRSRGGRVLSPGVGEWFWPERPGEEELRRFREKSGGRGRRERGRREDRGSGASRSPGPDRQPRGRDADGSPPAEGSGGQGPKGDGNGGGSAKGNGGAASGDGSRPDAQGAPEG